MAQEPGDRATVQMRDGTKVEGRIEELAGGTLFLRVSQHDQRRINVDDIALIDKKGGASGLPDTEIREARGAEHVLLLAGGNSVKGRLVTIKGGEGSSDPGPRTYVFRTADARAPVRPRLRWRASILVRIRSKPPSRASPADVAPVTRALRRGSRSGDRGVGLDRIERPQGRLGDVQHHRRSAIVRQRERPRAPGRQLARRAARRRCRT